MILSTSEGDRSYIQEFYVSPDHDEAELMSGLLQYACTCFAESPQQASGHLPFRLTRVQIIMCSAIYHDLQYFEGVQDDVDAGQMYMMPEPTTCGIPGADEIQPFHSSPKHVTVLTEALHGPSVSHEGTLHVFWGTDSF